MDPAAGERPPAKVPPLMGDDHQNSAVESLHLFEYLEQDDRGSYVLDLHAPPESNPIYWNPILRKNKGLRDRLLGLRKLYNLREAMRHSADWTFLQWQVDPDTAGHARSCRYGQSYWIATTLRNRWRVITSVLAVQMVPNEIPAAIISNTSSTSPAPRTYNSYRSKDTNEDSQDDPKFRQHSTHDEDPAASLHTEAGATHGHIQEYTWTNNNSALPVHVNGLIEDKFLNRPLDQDNRASIGTFDWTRPDPTVTVTPFVKFFRNFDWGSTSLGPIESWSIAMRRHVLLLMADPRPAAMFVGPEKITLYNEGYVWVIGSKHPFMMGKPFDEAWADLGDAFEPCFRRGIETGVATQFNDSGFFIERANFLEETYFRLSMIPVSLESGVSAFYNPVFETTQQVITARRMTFLLSVSAELAGSKEPKEFWESLERALESSPHEVPFSLMYSARKSLNEKLSTSEKHITREKWVLEGSIGYPLDTLASIPKILSPDGDAAQDFIPHFFDLVHDPEPTLLRRFDGSLPENLINKVQSRAFGDRCEAALLIPIRSTGENVLGFLLLGVDPRRPYDEDYVVFTQLLTSQLATAMASAVLFEDEARTRRTALSDRDKLSEKALEAEQRFQRMADLAPVAMFHFDETGMPIYCNDMWYAITEHPRGAEYPMSWYNVIHSDDHDLMDKEWAKLGSGASVSFEIRLKKPFQAAEVVGGERVKGDTWILASAYSQRREDGTISSILGCLTDISRQKWAEDFQTRRKKEALELKRQQENFIDMTSHEMRNPLSAIVQCADSIAASLSDFDGSKRGDFTMSREDVESSLDAAQTIALCAQHQTRIIDDVLTLSKLDSNLLHITPVDCQPAVVVENSLKIFDGELRKNDVELRLNIDKSYSELRVDWVKLDPSRVLQILINLLSNAIKFTSTQEKRRIHISVGASLQRPTSANGLHYLPSKATRQDVSDKPDSEWGTGELVYLQIQVRDTGKGLHEHERKLLFQRFSQTSPRTHVQYGGSGLGLFISRELTELQGGEIGVLSEAGVGSTFAFFVQSRRTDPPASAIPTHSPGQTPLVPEVSVFNIQKQKVLNPLAFSRLPNRSGSPSSTPKKGMTVSDEVRHVLVVEDNLVNQKVLSKQLRGAGCVVSVANHGGEALALLEKSRFCVDGGEALNVVLMDLEMPVMDGLTCTKKIREMQKQGKIRGYVPVIAVTANARSEQIATARDSGMASRLANALTDATDLFLT
ncbi:hypothetical protein N0V93_004367 [Gnomoniopsis smithogilvyi]|uniref:Uncharacterized protein n=1 Tax=Gnomoniopsis smithogilvyi TaxID=1191159 RepID=A0A9W9CX24_9PEZI|nr:hypothetical protein N0V93_004367 [Gnomoniopsis smithogilvyi]